MDKEKIVLEINQKTLEKIKHQFNSLKAQGGVDRLGIINLEDFITYILESFAESSNQMEKMNDSLKQMLEKVDLENLKLEDFFESIMKASTKRTEAKKEEAENSKKEDDKKPLN